MGYASDEKRWAIIALWKDQRTHEYIARHVKLSVNTVSRWINRYKSTGRVDFGKKTGRKPIISKHGAKLALELLESNNLQGASHVAAELKRRGVTHKVPHRTTVINHAKQAAEEQGLPLVCLRGKPRKGLTESTKAKRIQFAKENKDRDWSLVTFTDRCKFAFKYPGSVVRPTRWVRKGCNLRSGGVYQPNHPEVLNVYAGITKKGVTRMHIVTGTSKHQTKYKNKKGAPAKNITAEELYRDVVTKTLLPEGKRLLSRRRGGDWVLQQDNDPTHKAARKELQAWNNQHSGKVELLPNWPPNSPDLNPIENVWAKVQSMVNAEAAKSFDEYKAAVLRAFANLDLEYLSNLVDSMPKRLAELLEKDGERTGY